MTCIRAGIPNSSAKYAEREPSQPSHTPFTRSVNKEPEALASFRTHCKPSIGPAGRNAADGSRALRKFAGTSWDVEPSAPRNVYLHQPKCLSPSPEIARELVTEHTARVERRRKAQFKSPSAASAASAAAAAALGPPPPLPAPPFTKLGGKELRGRPATAVSQHTPADAGPPARPPFAANRSTSPYTSTVNLAERAGIARAPPKPPAAAMEEEHMSPQVRALGAKDFAVVLSGGEALVSRDRYRARHSWGTTNTDASSSGAFSSSDRLRHSLGRSASLQKATSFSKHTSVDANRRSRDELRFAPLIPTPPRSFSARRTSSRTKYVVHPALCSRSVHTQSARPSRDSFEAPMMKDIMQRCAKRRSEGFGFNSVPQTPRGLSERIYAVSTAGTPRAPSSRISVASSWVSKEGPQSRSSRRSELDGVFRI
jgi:hypothetical protein